MKLTIEDSSRCFSATVPDDTDATELLRVYMSLAVAYGYAEESIKETIIDEFHSIKETEPSD